MAQGRAAIKSKDLVLRFSLFGIIFAWYLNGSGLEASDCFGEWQWILSLKNLFFGKL